MPTVAQRAAAAAIISFFIFVFLSFLVSAACICIESLLDVRTNYTSAKFRAYYTLLGDKLSRGVF